MKSVTATDVTCGPDTGTTPEEVAASRLFREWLTRANVGGIRVESVHVLAAHRFSGSPEIKMIHLTAVAFRGDETDVLPGICLLRGDAVDIFTLLQTPNGQKYVVLVEQPRVPGAQARVRSNPSGMVEDETIAFAGLRELGEEIGNTTLKWRCPFDADGTGHGEPVHDMLADALHTALPALVSPGANDERVSHLVTLAEATEDELAELQRRFRSTEDEDITVLVVPLAELLQHLVPPGGSVDEKALTAALLYQQCVGSPIYEI